MASESSAVVSVYDVLRSKLERQNSANFAK